MNLKYILHETGGERERERHSGERKHNVFRKAQHPECIAKDTPDQMR